MRAMVQKVKRVVPGPNLFIGGAGASYISTPADLAALSTLTEEQIREFQVDLNDNVSCFVGSNYTASSNVYSDNSVTYVIDVDGNWNNGSHCNNADGLEYFYAPNLPNMNQFTLNGCAVLKRVSSGITTISNRFYLSNNATLERADLRELVNYTPTNSGGALYLMTALNRVYLGSATNINFSAERGSRILNLGRGPSFRNIPNGCKIYYDEVTQGVKDRTAFTRFDSGWAVGDTLIISGTSALTYTCVSGTPVTDGEFQNDGVSHSNAVNGNLRIAINADTRPGSEEWTAENDNALGYIASVAIGASGDTLTASLGVGNTGTGGLSMGGIFTGGTDVHPIFMSARDDFGATLVPITSAITVNTPTNLSVSAVTLSSATLNFTTVTANANGTETYEAWVDDGTVYRKHFYYKEIATTGLILDLTEVVDDGGTVSGCKIKVRTMDGHMNFSDFSNEITI